MMKSTGVNGKTLDPMLYIPVNRTVIRSQKKFENVNVEKDGSVGSSC